MKFSDFLMRPEFLGSTYAAPSRRAWATLAKAMGAEQLTGEELAVLTKLTARTSAPVEPARETYVIAGRRSGKSQFAAAAAVHACALDYSASLAVGEVATVAVVACDRAQAQTVFRYAKGFIEQCEVLRREVVREVADEIEFAHNVRLEVHTADFRRVRGRTFACVIFDEAAFMKSEESTSPDVELRRAVLPGLATLPGARLIAISSPWARRGLMFEQHARHYGKPSNTLVVQADSRSLNPSLSAVTVEEALEADPEAARAEWLGEFRSDLAQFLPDELLDRAVAPGRAELAPQLVPATGSPRRTHFFVDPSGGRHDAMTLSGVCLSDSGKLVQTVVRGVSPPFDPAQVVEEFAALVRSYGAGAVTGDRFSGEWVVSAFAKHGIAYVVSDLTRSEIYAASLPLFAQGKVELLDHRRTLAEFRALERRARAGGREFIDHGPRGSDDFANATAGALVLASRHARAVSADELARSIHIEPLRVLDEYHDSGGGPYPFL